MKTYTKLGVLSFAVLAAASSAQAVTFETAGIAKAEITAAPNGGNTDVTVVLTNLTPATIDPYQANNTLTGVTFGGITAFTLVSQSTPNLFIMSSDTVGAVSPAGAGEPNWIVDPTLDGLVPNLPLGLYFNGFGNDGRPIISEAVGGTSIPNGGPSLTAGPHGTYGYITATFNLTVAGDFDPAAIDDLVFRFNTDGLTRYNGDCLDCGGDIPEPASLGIVALGAIGLATRRRRA